MSQASDAPHPGGAEPTSGQPKKHLAVNILSLVLVIGLLMSAGWWMTSRSNSNDQCRPPSADRLAAQRAVVADAIDSRRAAVVDARHQVGAARRQLPPGAATSPKFERATKRLDRAIARLGRWQAQEATVDPQARTTFKLGNDPDPGTHSVKFNTIARIPGPRLVSIDVAQFSPAESGREFSEDTLTAWAKMDKDRKNGVVYLCMEAGERESAPSGTYSGTITLADNRVQRLDVPVSMSMAWPKPFYVLGIGGIVCFIASWYVYFLRRPDLPDAIKFGPDAGVITQAKKEEADRTLRYGFQFWLGYWRFVTTAVGGLTIAAGTVGAATAFAAQYLSSADWSPGLGAWATFAGAVGSAFVAGATTGRLAGNTYWKTVAASEDGQPSPTTSTTENKTGWA
jgi:hypothetical protein